jgi:hypothetical protein
MYLPCTTSTTLSLRAGNLLNSVLSHCAAMRCISSNTKSAHCSYTYIYQRYNACQIANILARAHSTVVSVIISCYYCKCCNTVHRTFLTNAIAYCNEETLLLSTLNTNQTTVCTYCIYVSMYDDVDSICLQTRLL